ncbi:MAG: hypothetical protein IMZ44_22505 [Planctomycetes bacterium]|nr:hypothetical protein [Planctomycetota bacterium]
MESRQLWRDVMQAAVDFNDRRLWKRFTNFDCFAVRIPERNAAMLASVLGDAGEGVGAQGASLANGPRQGNRNNHSLPASGGTGLQGKNQRNGPQPATTKNNTAPGER